MRVEDFLKTDRTRHRVYFKDPRDAAMQLGLDPQAVRVSKEKHTEAAKALKAKIRELTFTWPEYDKEHTRYYLEVGDPWDDRLKDLVDTALTYKHRKSW